MAPLTFVYPAELGVGATESAHKDASTCLVDSGDRREESEALQNRK